MTSECPLCKTSLPDGHPAIILKQLSEFVRSNGGWYKYASDHTSYGYPVGTTFIINGGAAATVEAKKTTFALGELDMDDLGGELPQGTNFNTYIIIKVADYYFKMTGTGDSYGEVTWDGELSIVTPVEKIIKEYV